MANSYSYYKETPVALYPSVFSSVAPWEKYVTLTSGGARILMDIEETKLVIAALQEAVEVAENNEYQSRPEE